MRLSELKAQAAAGAPTRVTLSQLKAQAPAPVADDGTAWMKDWKAADDMSGFQKFVAGYGGAIPDLARGAKELITGKTNYEDEASRRKAMSELGLAGTVGNVAGNVSASLPAMAAAVPAGVTGIPAALLAMGIGGAEGAGMAALAPTAREGERGENVKIGGGIGAAIPFGGAVMRSRPAKKAIKEAMDWNPLFRYSRLKARNAKGLAARDEVVAQLKSADEMDMARYNAGLEDVDRTYTGQVDQAKQAAKAATERNVADEAARVSAENQARDAGIAGARQEVSDLAGWSAVPTTSKEAGEQLKAVGERYGKKIDPVEIPASKTVKVLDGAAAASGLETNQVRRLQSFAKMLGGGTEAKGVEVSAAPITGKIYRDTRANITEELKTATGTYRTQLLAAKNALDNDLQVALKDSPDVYGEIVDLRNKYSMGSTVAGRDIDPAKGMDIWNVRASLDKKYGGNVDETGARDVLVEAVKKLNRQPAKVGKVAKVEPVLPLRPAPTGMPPAPRDLPPKFKSQGLDLARVIAINAPLTVALGGFGHLAAAPAAWAARKVAKNETAAQMTSRLLRGYMQSELSD